MRKRQKFNLKMLKLLPLSLSLSLSLSFFNFLPQLLHSSFVDSFHSRYSSHPVILLANVQSLLGFFLSSPWSLGRIGMLVLCMS